MSPKIHLPILLFLSFFLFWAVPTWPQSEAVSANLTGTVQDPNGATVPGASVTLSNASVSFSRQVITGDNGLYTFSLIPPGTYQLKVEKVGFDSFLQSNIVLAVGQSSTLNARLQVGNVNQVVEVTAQAPVLNTGSADLGSEVSSKQAVELPLNIRNVYGLVELDSSVNNSQQFQALNPPGSQGNVDQDIAFFNFGGGRFGTTAFLLDGAWDGAGDWDGVIYVPSVDELQEFRIQTNTFSPQYGLSMGNVVNAVTKSGTRSLHGDAFEFLRNNNLDANNYFNNLNGLARPQFKRNQFGFTVGGPVYIPHFYKQRDKTFIFGAYEGLRQQTPTTLLTTVPTVLQRGGDFSQTFNQDGSLATIYDPFSTRLVNRQYVRTPFTNNTIPTTELNPVAVKLMNYYPLPNKPGAALTGANNFAGTAGLPTNSDQYTIKVDENISEKQNFYARWSQKRQFKQLEGEFFGASDPGGNGTLAPDNRFEGGIGYTYVFSPAFVMSLNFGWGRWVEARKPQGVPFDVTTVGLPAAINSYLGPGAFPNISLSGYQNLGSGSLNATPREARTYAADFTRNLGAHSLSMGFMGITFILNTFNSAQASFNFAPDFTQGPFPTAANADTGSSAASFLLGTADNSSAGISYTAEAAYSKANYGWYFNDDWKATKSLTLNLGVRYDIQTAPRDRFNRLSYFTLAANPISSQLPGLNLPGDLQYVNGNNRGVYDTNYKNFAPRVGLAYSAFKNFVFRAGYGIFYTPAMEFGDYQGLSLNGYSQTTPYVGTLDGVTPQNLLSNPFPTGLLAPVGQASGGATNVGQNINAVLPNRASPYVQQWTANMQYQLGGTVFQAAYIGNHGTKLLFGSTTELNQLPTADLALGNQLLQQVPNPFYGVITSGALSSPTVAYGQLLRPFPEYTGVEDVQPPSASSTYNALAISANRRFSKGLQFLVSYTWSKYLTNSEGPEGWTNGQAQSVRNWYNTSLEKSLMIDDIPRSLVVSYVYELPVGKGKPFAPSNKVVDAAIGGWQVAGISNFKDGFPLSITDATNNTNSFGGNQRPNIVGNPNLNGNSIYEFFNTAAFTQPLPFTFGNVPRTMGYLRSQGTNSTDLTLQKYWQLWNETSRLQLRAEFYNIFNRTQFFAPGTTYGTSTFGVIPGALAGRSIQFGMKLYW
ncbi:MAG TPA: TonB-dependent receptor [Bryobacteraceae bacterium]